MQNFEEPKVTIGFSESGLLKKGERMTLKEADDLLKMLNDRQKDWPGYDKTDVTITYYMNKDVHEYSFRYDIGDEDGGIVDHIKDYYENIDWAIDCHRSEGREEKAERLESDKKSILNLFVPYLKKHIWLEEILYSIAHIHHKDIGMTELEFKYYDSILDWIVECREILNNGNLELPKAPVIEDIIKKEEE